MPAFQAPSEFDFTKPNTWPDWIQRFRRYRTASKLDREDGTIQVSTLIYCIGVEGERLLSSFRLTADQLNDFDTVVEKFDSHFVPKRNLIHERALFNMRSQKEGENIESYVRSLYELSENTGFQDREEAIRDRLVLGVRDRELSEKLQLQSDLTLQSATEMARQFEQVKSQLVTQREGSGSLDAVQKDKRAVDDVQGKVKDHKGQRWGTGHKRNRGQPQGSGTPKCQKCGGKHGRSATCPAKGKECHKCHKLNHFARECKSKGLHNLTAGTGRNSLFLGSLGTDDEPWRITIPISGKAVSFKIDTGADVSAISESVYKSISPRPKLKHSDTVLQSPGGKVAYLGQFVTQTEHRGNKVSFRVFVLKGSTDCLLSREAAIRLCLVRRLDATEAKDLAFGDIGPPIQCDPVKIVLAQDAEPYSISVPRRIPIPLLPKVEKELKRMEENDVIEKVTEPTDWCAGMVPVLKKNGDVRICVDLKHLNKS